MSTPRTPRRTLWQHGRRGDADWMRVLVDEKQDRVEVLYKDGRGVRRKEMFGNDRRGKADAIAWAETYRDERKRLGAARLETTHAQLWAKYTASPAWADLRARSKPSYLHRWQRWVTFRGASTRPDDTTLHHIDQYIMRAREQGVAINQIRQVLNVARVVYNWGQSRKLITENVFSGYRWKTPKDAIMESPGEYSEEEFNAILAELSPQDSRRWRANVMLLLAGYHGQRGNALTHLRAEDVHDGSIVWPAKYQKNGKPLEQPLTWDGYAAILTARYWRERLGYTGPWLLPGGSQAKRGVVRELREWEKDPKHKRVGTGKGAARRVADEPYAYSSGHAQLIAAEIRAGVEHQPRRAFHGFRKMAAGNVADVTGDTRLALQWIGDDIRQAPAYLKKRAEHMDRAAAAVQRTPKGTRTSVPEVSETQKAPEGALANHDND